MPIQVSGARTWVVFGTGDVAFFGSKEKRGGRQYLVFENIMPGAIGFGDPAASHTAIRRGYRPDTDNPCIVFEFANVESLDQMIAALQDHRAEKFPEDPGETA